MLVSTNVRFLEEDYMIDNKLRAKNILEELRGEGNDSPVMMTQVSPPPVCSTQEREEPRHSGGLFVNQSILLV